MKLVLGGYFTTLPVLCVLLHLEFVSTVLVGRVQEHGPRGSSEVLQRTAVLQCLLHHWPNNPTLAITVGEVGQLCRHSRPVSSVEMEPASRSAETKLVRYRRAAGNGGRQSGGGRRRGPRSTTVVVTEVLTTQPTETTSISTTTVVATNEWQLAEVVVNSEDKPETIVSEWMWTASFVTDNTEKLVLYSLLSVALGAVSFLLVVVGFLRCRSRHSRRQSSDDESRAALNATGNFYSPSPASSADERPAPRAGPSWWSRDDDDNQVGWTQSGSTSQPAAGTSTRYILAADPTSANGRLSESNAASSGSGTTGSRRGLSAGGGRNGHVLLEDTDDELVTLNSNRPSTMSTAGGVAQTDIGDPWSSGGNGGGTGTLGRSYTNPYRHDSYRVDGMRTMQFK